MNDLMIKENEQLTGLTETKAKQIKAVFNPMMEKLEQVEESYNNVVSLDVSPETCVLAKRMRLDIAKIRIEADKIRKVQKDEFLRAGNAIQGIYNIIKFAVVSKEEKLKDIELHYEKIEEEKKAQLQLDRQVELARYDADGEFVDLGNMPDPVWKNYLAGVKNNYEAIKEAERKAEADRVEQENIDNLNEERRVSILNLWQFLPEENKNENFGAWADDMWDEFVNYLNLTKSDYDKEQEEIKAENERLKIEADKAEKKRIAAQKKLDKERAAKKKLENDIAENEAERLRLEKVESDRLKTEQKKAKNAPDKLKLEKLVFYMEEIGRGLKGPKAKEIVREAYRLIKGYSKSL